MKPERSDLIVAVRRDDDRLQARESWIFIS
jgi:hypothetical protein